MIPHSNEIDLVPIFGNYISSIRNVFLVASLSFVSFNYGNSFRNRLHRKYIHFLSFILMLISISKGGIYTTDLTNFIADTDVSKKNEYIYVQIKHHLFFAYLSLFILTLFALISLKRLYDEHF